jgi:hypothetical protein
MNAEGISKAVFGAIAEWLDEEIVGFEPNAGLTSHYHHLGIG